MGIAGDCLCLVTMRLVSSTAGLLLALLALGVGDAGVEEHARQRNGRARSVDGTAERHSTSESGITRLDPSKEHTPDGRAEEQHGRDDDDDALDAVADGVRDRRHALQNHVRHLLVAVEAQASKQRALHNLWMPHACTARARQRQIGWQAT